MKFHAWLIMALLVSTAACSKRDDGGDRAGGSPDISPTAAPGVAFSYRYAFALNDTQITAAQEAMLRRANGLALTAAGLRV
jgi:hypothetical protein